MDWENFIKYKAKQFHKAAPYVDREDLEQEGRLAQWLNRDKDPQVIMVAVEKAMWNYVDQEVKQRGPFICESFFYSLDYSKITKLTSRQREVLRMYYNERKDPKTICKELGIAIPTFYKIRGQAIRKILRLYNEL